MDFSTEQRYNIVSDITHWKVELEEVGGGGTITDDDLEAYVSELYSLTDDELYDWWTGTVGEWVASRSDMSVPTDMDFSDWLDNQFEQMANGEDPPWGYITPVSVPRADEM